MAKKLKIKVDLNAKDLKSKMGLKDGLNGKTPIKGVDYFDGVSPDPMKTAELASKIALDELKPQIPSLVPLATELPKYGEPIRDSLELLSPDKWLSKDFIAGLEDYDEVSKLARQPRKIEKIYQSVANNTGGSSSPLTTKGDLWGYSTLNTRLPVGANNLPLVADSTQTAGVGYQVLKPIGGGFGQSMDMQTNSSSSFQGAFPAGNVKWTGTGGTLTLAGIAAPTTSNFSYIQNASNSSLIVITNQNTGATANNRIITNGGATLTVPAGCGVMFMYDTVTLRWRVLNIDTIRGAAAPLTIGSSGQLGIPQASSIADGYLTATNFDLFSNKVAGNLEYHSVPYAVNSSGSPAILSGRQDYLNFDPSTVRLGVGVVHDTAEATGHFKSDTPVTIPTLTGLAATLVPFTPIPAPTTYTVTQITGHMDAVTSQSATQAVGHIQLPVSLSAPQSPGHLYAPTSFSAFDTGSGTGYLLGDVIDYRITAYDSTGAQTYSIVNSSASVTISSVTSDAGLTWVDDTTGTATISGYFIERQVNGGGYNDAQDVGYVNSFNDDGVTGWAAYSYPLSPVFPDYIANGTTRDYNIWQAVDDGMGGYIWAANGATVSLTDDNSGTPYIVPVGWGADASGSLGSPTNFRVYNQINGGGYVQYIDTVSPGIYDEVDTAWIAGTPPPSPQTSDYVAIGQTIDYLIWQGGDDGMGGNIWSVVTNLASVTDNGSGEPYVVSIGFAQNNTGTETVTKFRVYRNVGGAGYFDYQDYTSNIIVDDNTGWISGSPNPSPQYPDFVANGSTRNYSAYTIGLAPDGSQLYSQAHYDIPFMDDNSNNSYLLQHYVDSPSSSGNNTILNTDLTTSFDFANASYLTEDTTTFGSGSTVTPNTFGLVADGVTWNRNYDFYNFDTPLAIYSASSGTFSVVDPNDSQYYYTQLDFSGVNSYAKILADKGDGNGWYWSDLAPTSPFYDSGSNFTSTDVTVTTNAFYPPTGLFESHGSSLTDKATIISRSLDGDYSRFEFQDNTSTRLGYIEAKSTWVSINNVAFITGSRVGINNSNPTYDLDVTGQINATTDYLINGVTIRAIRTDGSNNYWTSNTTIPAGSNNLALGFNSLSSNSGGDNVAIGSQVLVSNTTGGKNFAMGGSALYNNTTGDSNTAIGPETLTANTTGSFNTSIGILSLHNNTNGSSNIAIGTGALHDNTTGSSNVGLGDNAGYSGTTGSKNVSIGYSVGLPSTTADGQLTIQNAIYGTSNTSINTSVSSGNIGLFVKAPTARLHLIEGATGAGKAPLKFTSGSLMTTAEAGAIEFDGTDWYLTI